MFLDLDGTIVDIVEHPDATRVKASTLRLLEKLSESFGRALAVISGRDIPVIDRLLHPLVLPVAGVHGLRRRDASGIVHATETRDFKHITFVLEKIMGDEPGVVIERKPGAVAVHYRLRPDLERRCCEIVSEVMEQRPDLKLLHGKMVFEIAQAGADKGAVIGAFLSEAPFQGRAPIFAGDDVSDESGFCEVNAREGISIKVGQERSAARFHAANVQELEDWLHGLIRDDVGERLR
jgi:trehalose 6-phosphate phosphatase